MDASLNQPCRVEDEGLLGCKLLLLGKKITVSTVTDGTQGISTGELRASSRGNTEGASVIRIYWV